MKKIFLLIVLLFQLTYVFGQTPIAEDEKVIQYSTNWGTWITAPNNNNILFSARLKWYDKKTKLYAWDIRRKVLKMPIAFEWKITNQVFTGASDNVEVNDGYYKTAVFDSKDNSNVINGSGFAIYSTSKTTLYYQIRNVCYEFDGREPNCEISKSKTTSKNNNEIKNNSKRPNEIILDNIKLFLKEEIHLIYPGLTVNTSSVIIENDNLEFSTEVIDKMQQYPCPSSKTYFTYSVPIKDLFLEKIEKDVYAVGIQKVINIKANQNLKVQGKKYRQNPSECSPLTEDKYYAENKTVSEFQFEYNFGTNDKNFIELQNAIEALKNPNKKSVVTSKQSSNVQETQENTKTMSIEEANQYLILAATAYTEGRIEDAKKHYLETIESFPNYKPDAYFNLGVITTSEGKTVEAEKYYLKTIELFPDYKDAYLNLSVLRLEKDKVIVNEMNKLGTTQSDIIKYNNLLKKRNQLFKNVAPLLEKYRTIDGENSDVNKTLLNIYEAIGDQQKIKLLKQKM